MSDPRADATLEALLRDKLLHVTPAGPDAPHLPPARPEAATRISLDPDRVERDLARLVLALLELLRRLMEAQAIRRVERGTLTDEEIERLGLGLMRAEAAIRKLCRAFELDEADLNLDLGPLGRLF